MKLLLLLCHCLKKIGTKSELVACCEQEEQIEELGLWLWLR